MQFRCSWEVIHLLTHILNTNTNICVSAGIFAFFYLSDIQLEKAMYWIYSVFGSLVQLDSLRCVCVQLYNLQS